MRNPHIILSFLALSILPVLYGGCAGKDIDENNPEEMYRDAIQDVDADRYAVALEKFRKIKNKFPYSKYSILARLKTADVYYSQESFLEAASAYESFVELHPKHDQVPYALFRTGESYHEATPTQIARDINTATKAIAAYENYLGRFPKDENNDKAKERSQKLRETLAEKQLYIANFYYRQDQYRAARLRYESILRDYSGTIAEQEAKVKLQKTVKELEKQESERSK